MIATFGAADTLGACVVVYFLFLEDRLNKKKLISNFRRCFIISFDIGAFIVGRLSDYTGRVPVLVTGAMFGMIGIAVASYGNHLRLWPSFVGMVLLGLCDACINTQVTAILPILQPSRTGPAFACKFRSFYEVASVHIVL